MVAIGIILLAPGLCSLIFSVGWMGRMLFDAAYHPGRIDEPAYRMQHFFDGLAMAIMLAGTSIGAAGAGIIVFAIPRRSSRVPALLILTGIILLLPGLCSLMIFAAIMLAAGGFGGDPEFLLLLAFGILMGAGGLALIVLAIWRYRSSPAVQ
jgi:hypothetical protein